MILWGRVEERGPLSWRRRDNGRSWKPARARQVARSWNSFGISDGCCRYYGYYVGYHCRHCFSGSRSPLCHQNLKKEGGWIFEYFFDCGVGHFLTSFSESYDCHFELLTIRSLLGPLLCSRKDCTFALKESKAGGANLMLFMFQLTLLLSSYTLWF